MQLTSEFFKRERLFIFFLTLIGTFILIRGFNLSSTLPPFEGWDEYQHLAVAEFVYNNGVMPSYQAKIPGSLLPFLSSYGHPNQSAKQLHGLGAKNYFSETWDTDKKQWGKPEIMEFHQDRLPPLYQAQHGPVFYHLLSSIKSFFQINNFKKWSLIGRYMNVVFTALFVISFALIIRLADPQINPRLTLMVTTLCAINPLLIFNGSRVTNDALAMLLASISLLVYFLYKSFSKTRSGLAAKTGVAVTFGILIAASVLTKATTIIIAPVIAVGIFFLEAKRLKSRWLACYMPTLLILVYFLIAGKYHLESYTLYGNITGMQESLRLRESGLGIMDVISALLEFRFGHFKNFFFFGFFKIGGWTELPSLEVIRAFYKYTLYVILLLYLSTLFSPRIKRQGAAAFNMWELTTVLFLMWVAMLFHAANYSVVWGAFTTNTHYSVLTIFILFCALLGFDRWNTRLTNSLFASLLIGSLVTYYIPTSHLIAVTQGIGFSPSFNMHKFPSSYNLFLEFLILLPIIVIANLVLFSGTGKKQLLV